MLVELSVKQVVREHLSSRYYMILHAHNDETKRYISISVGQAEAEAVEHWLGDITPPRPMTYDLICSLVAMVEKVEILRIIIDGCDDNNVYYAKMVLNVEGHERVLDCRPSDAVAIAVRLDVPIYAEFCLLDKFGFCCGSE